MADALVPSSQSSKFFGFRPGACPARQHLSSGAALSTSSHTTETPYTLCRLRLFP